jgi:16S rRNA (guanine527-N7)-methyltransferase
LAAANPAWEVTFFDSVAKKTKALEDCLQGTGWNAKTLTGRAEDLGRNPKTRETWDGVSARAVADLPVLLEYALPLLKPGGYLVNWMTEDQLSWLDHSQKAMESLKGRIAQQVNYSLPGLAQARILLVVEKLGKTPQEFPRAVGVPSKRPL